MSTSYPADRRGRQGRHELYPARTRVPGQVPGGTSAGPVGPPVAPWGVAQHGAGSGRPGRRPAPIRTDGGRRRVVCTSDSADGPPASPAGHVPCRLPFWPRSDQDGRAGVGVSPRRCRRTGRARNWSLFGAAVCPGWRRGSCDPLGRVRGSCSTSPAVRGTVHETVTAFAISRVCLARSTDTRADAY